MTEEIDLNQEEESALDRAWDKMTCDDECWLPGKVYFGSLDEPLPDWREEETESDTDDDAEPSEEEEAAVIEMLGFDPDEDDDCGDDECEEEEDLDEEEEEYGDDDDWDDDSDIDEDDDDVSLSFREDLHPRRKKGDKKGGQFTKAKLPPWRKYGKKKVTYGSMTSSYRHHHPLKIKGPHINLPNYRQTDEHSCSLVAALAVVHHFNPNIDPREVMAAIRPTKSGGANRRRVIEALAEFGIDAEYRKDLTLDDLHEQVQAGTPVMITVYPEDWSSDHWTVVQGFDNDRSRVYLSNHYSLPISQFKKDWYDEGEGIICKKQEKRG